MTNTIKEQEKQETTYKVYIHRNKINNKRYIGITKKNTKQRWRNGEGYKNQSLFYNAIKKYGWDNFTHKVVFKNLTKEEAAEKEKELIKKYNSNNSLYGYNVEKGGFDIDKEKIERLHRGQIRKKSKIVITSFLNNNQIIFDNVEEASNKTGLDRQYIIDCCNKIIINKYYDIAYLNKKAYR
jgi:hypothetical protein